MDSVDCMNVERYRQQTELMKSELANLRCRVMYMIGKEGSSSEDVWDSVESMNSKQEDTLQVLSEVFDVQNTWKDVSKMEEMRQEMGLLVNDTSKVQRTAQAYFESKCAISDSSGCNHVNGIGTDLWTQLKKISMPMFSGDKTMYPGWKAAFMACIDESPFTPEYKLLQMRQYLSGEPLKIIEKLGFSAHAYTVAKDKLDKKYGGKRRKVAIQLDEIKRFPHVRENNAQDLEAFSDMLDIAAVNLQESNMLVELGDGMLYAQLQQKLPEKMVCEYNRWIDEKKKSGSVEALREWLLCEVEFRVEANEAVHGFSQKSRTETSKSFLTNRLNDEVERNSNITTEIDFCILCDGTHHITCCEVLQSMTVAERWEVARQKRLCFRCIQVNHKGKDCSSTRVCGTQGCRKTHNPYLHRDESRYDDIQSSGHGVEQHSAKVSPLTSFMTVPVIIKNGNQRRKVNALLDDASDKSYINESIAEELGLYGPVNQHNVCVINGHVNSFQSMEVTVNLESVEGDIDVTLQAYASQNVAGDVNVVDWQRQKYHWEHLQSIQFPDLAPSAGIDLLIGMNLSQLHYSYRDVKRYAGEPLARKTPLGWTCISYCD